MNKVEELVEEEGYKKIVLECMQEKNLPHYYQKLGYKKYKTLKHMGHHDVYMVKEL